MSAESNHCHFVLELAPRKQTQVSFQYFRYYSSNRPMLATGPAWIPPLDLYETNDDFVLEVNLGGIAPEEVHVQVEGRLLRFWGERLGATGEGVRCYHAMEIERGIFDRTIEFPCPVDPRSTKVAFHEGLLVLHIKKIEGGGLHGCFSADSMEGLE